MSEFLDLAKDFCTDNYIWIIGALVVLILILIGVAVGKRKNRGDGSEGREYFLEGEYDAMLKNAALNVKEVTGAAEISRANLSTDASTGLQAELTADTPSGQQTELTTDTPSGQQADLTEIIQAEMDALVEASEKEEPLITNEHKQEEELQPVHININIQHGQVKIDYDEDGKIRCTVETDSEEDEVAATADNTDTADVADHAGLADTADVADLAGTADDTGTVDVADTADVADNADLADLAGTADDIGTVDVADAAEVAETADTADVADTVGTGDFAGTADAVETAEAEVAGEAANTHDFIKDKGVILEKIELVKAAPAKKYGRDNFNTSRSGRIYTEEELRKQIKR